MEAKRRSTFETDVNSSADSSMGTSCLRFIRVFVALASAVLLSAAVVLCLKQFIRRLSQDRPADIVCL